MKVSVSSGYIYVVLGVILVAALTLFEVTCPIDGGTGVITGNKDIEATEVEGELVDYEFYVICGETYSEYTYAVKITLVNETTISQYGALVIEFYDSAAVHVERYEDALSAVEGDEGELPEGAEPGGMVTTFRGPPVAKRLVTVKIPAETARTIEKIIRFEGFGLEEHAKITPTLWAVTEEKIVCPYCGGTGTVPIIEWPRID